MFDEENLQKGYQCECGGNITLYDGRWHCDKCDFDVPDNCEVRTDPNTILKKDANPS